MKDEKLVQAEKLNGFCRQALKRVGMSDHDASIVAYTIIEAEIRGIISHGIALLPEYIRLLREGNSNPRPNVKIIQETDSTAILDGDNALGGIPAVKAMEIAIKKAKDCSIAGVAVRNSGPCAALVSYTTLAIEHNMIGFMTASAHPIVPPFGGKTGFLGTNPWSFAIPAGEELPIILDMATTVAANLKIRLAAKKGSKIPLGWALDQDGRPTDDPEQALSGISQWMGGPKGYGLAVVTAVLAGILPGGSFRQMASQIGDGFLPGLGQFVAALNIGSFIPLTEFTSKVDQMIRGLKASERIEGINEILLPGERGLRTKEERLKSGIPIALAIWGDIENLGKELNISIYIE
jgi:LDH2 family malate/lactate/ureidoglycolate dehydrogenase